MLLYIIIYFKGKKDMKRENSLFKKGDKLVIAFAIVLIVVSFSVFFLPRNNGERIVIKQNNKIVYNESLKTDKKIQLHNNTIIIKDGFVYMESAKCKNQLCVHHTKISKKGESIICLPNKVAIQIK